MGPRLRARAWRGCPNSPSGGCNWGMSGTHSPGHPEQNGAHEQFHAVLKAEPPDRRRGPPPPNNVGLAVFGANTTRTGRTRRSITPPPPCTIGPRRAGCRRAFQASTIWALRGPTVGSNGCVAWHQRVLFLGRALVGHDIGFDEIVDGVWAVHVGPLRIAHFDARTAPSRRCHGDDSRHPPLAPYDLEPGPRGRSATPAPRACPSDPQSSVTHVLRDLCYLCLRNSILSHRKCEFSAIRCQFSAISSRSSG